MMVTRMPTTERCSVPPRALRKQKLKDEIVRLRTKGLTYRQIGKQVGVSHVYARRLLEEAYEEAGAELMAKADAASLERLVALTRPSTRMPATKRRSAPSHADREQKRKGDVVRLRTIGLTYREIGKQVCVSHVYARRLALEAFEEAGAELRANAKAALGVELERLNALTYAASRIMDSDESTVSEKLQAMNAIRAQSETRVRWLGLAPSRKPKVRC